VGRPPRNPSLAEVQGSLGRVIEELAQPPTRQERKSGWLEETQSKVAAHLRAIRDDIDGDIPPHPRDLPSQVEVVRWLDALGVALGDPLVDRVMDAFAVARRYANRNTKRD
jgi:hypothetical protein